MDTRAGIRGRDDVLRAIDAFVTSVRDGPVAVLLEGVAGIGKTMVWTAGVDMATAAGHRVLRSRPVRAEARLGFAGLGDLLGAVQNAELAQLPSAQNDAINAALLRSNRTTADARTVAVAVAGLLRVLSEERPIVIAIDDVQWLDAATQRILQFVLRRLDHEHIGFLSTRRREPDEQAVGPLGGVLGDLPLERIWLGPLAGESVIHLLNAELNIDLPKITLNQVVQASGGNPLYALEIGRGLSSTAMLAPGDPLPIPDNLRGVVSRRLRPLDVGARHALLLLALLGRPRADVVTRALTNAGVSLQVATAAGLVEEDGDFVRFTHPLLASVVVREAAPEDRRAAHRLLADVVDDIEERARHLALGADGEDEIAASELEAAAKVARARGAPEAAAELLELAAALTPATRAEERHRLTVAAASDLYNAGDVRHSRALLEGVVAVLEAGPQRASALGLLASVRFSSDSVRDALTIAEQALIEAEGDDALSMSLEFTAALALSITGDYPAAKHHLGTAREIAGRLGIDEAVDGARAFEVMLQSPLDPDLDAWVGVDAIPLLGGNGFIRGNRLLWEGDLDEARTVFEDTRAEFLATGDDGTLPAVLGLLVKLECWAADFNRARACGAEALAITEFTGRDSLRAVVLASLVLVNALQDPEELARSTIEGGIALAERTGALSTLLELRWAQGVLDLSTGNAEAAAARFTAGREGMGAMSVEHPAGLRFLVDEVEALLACGRRADAEGRLALFPTSGRAADLPWIRAAHARARGLVASSEGDNATALDALTVALEIQAATPMRFELARTWLADGRVRRRAKQWGSARRSLTEALALFEELATPHWAAQARAELGRVGGRRPSGDELSATEQRVATLVATGRTNREVADELFLSQKTVEWHLSRIYRKLRVRNRAELGANLARTKTADSSPGD